LNLDMPYFHGQIPTSENLARVLWTKLDSQRDIGRLHTVRLCEDEDLYAEVTADGGLEVASVTRRYTFNAVEGGNQGRDWDCFLTVHGPIDPVTGMVTDIEALDRLVAEKVLKRVDKQDLRQVLHTQSASGEDLARHLWQQMVPHITTGRLVAIRLVQSRDLAFEVSA